MRGYQTLLVFLLWLPLTVSAADNSYLKELTHQARQNNLPQRAEWLNLLHYKPYPLLPGSRSLADDPAFF